MKKEKTKKNIWKKLLYALVIIIAIIVVLFTIISDFVSYDNPNATVKEILYLKEDFSEDDILSSNKIYLTDISDAESKLNQAGVMFINNGKFDAGFDLDAFYLATSNFSINDYEIGALFNKYINSSASVDNLVSIKELTLTEDASTTEEQLKNFNVKIVLLFNLKSIFGSLSSSDLGYLENIYITINTKAFIAQNQFTFLNEKIVKINNLTEEKSKDVLKFLNGSYSTDTNNNIEKLSTKFLQNFINKIVSKTNTLLSISETNTSNGLFTFSLA